jgi:hypothetical protein
MQQLLMFQSLWAMEQRRPGVAEDSVETWFAHIAAAGYDGVGLDPAVDEIEAMRALRPLFEQHGLRCMVNAFPRTLDELTPLLRLAREMDAVLVNVIGQVMPLTVREGVQVVRRWLEDAQREGVPLLFETHRDCTLNDLHYTLQLLERVPELRLAADLSHYVIDREMRLPLTPTDAFHMQQVIERADCFQGRIASREQVQVQIGFPQHQAWVQQFREWWQQGLTAWRRRSADDAELVFLCELGPPPYAITDANGAELSDRWQEALTIRGWVEDMWARSAPSA